MSFHQIRRDARNFAISSKKSLCELKKNESRGRELVHAQAAFHRRLDVRHPVRDRERKLLDRRRARLADVVAADRDRVPPGELARPELDRVDDEPHRRVRRVQELLLGDVLLEDVVLRRPFERSARDARLLGRDDVHRPDRRRRRVDRHRRADPVEREPLEQELHVREAADGHPAGAELAFGLGVVGVVAVERGHVVGDREAGLTRVEQLPEPGVRILRAAEPGEHAHRPGPRPVARRVDAAGERWLPGHADVAGGIEVRVAAVADAQRLAGVVDLGGAARPGALAVRRAGCRLPVPRPVQPLDRDVAERGELGSPLGQPLERGREALDPPGLPPPAPRVGTIAHAADSSTCASAYPARMAVDLESLRLAVYRSLADTGRAPDETTLAEIARGIPG